MGVPRNNFHPDILAYIENAVAGFDQIPAERKEKLKEIAEFVSSKVRLGERADLTYICTHNSRRSHMGQLWAKVAADYFSVDSVQTFSGGTESTAFNPRAVAAMRRAGFKIQRQDEAKNPVYDISYGAELPVQQAWSKKYDDAANPSRGFAAVMTCSHADANCPIVFGAAERISIPYEDPKEADNTAYETQRYDERCLQIATEMLYCFSLVKS